MPPAAKFAVSRIVRGALAYMAAAMALGFAMPLSGAEGDLRWRQPWVVGDTTRKPYIESSPAIDDKGDVYIGVKFGTTPESGAVVALSPVGDDVQEKWFINVPDRVEATPLIGPDGMLYIGCLNGKMYARDKDTAGTKWKWEYDTNDESPDQLTYIHSSAALSPDGSVLYFGVGTFAGVSDARGALFAIRASDGKFLWAKWTDGPVEASPAVGADGTIYVGSWDHNLYAVRPDGSEKWRRALDSSIWASAALGSDGTIYVGTIGNQFVALTPDNELKWQRPLTTPGSPALGADGTIFVGSWGDGTLCALRPGDGSMLWSREGKPSGGGGSTPTVRGDGVVIFGGADKTMRAYDAATGDIRWSNVIRYEISSCPAVSPQPEHGIFFGAVDGRLYCLRGSDTGLSRYSNWPTFQNGASRTGRAADLYRGGRLSNLASRGSGTADDPLIAGFVVEGTSIQQLLVRAVGPSLRSYGIASPLGDPAMSVWVARAYSIDNDDWGSSPDADTIASTAARVGAFPLARDSKDAAALGLFVSGVLYTEVIKGADGGTGVTLAEIYDADMSNRGARLVNLSTRGHVGTGDGVLIGGLCVGGSGKLRVLVRGVGPGLAKYGVTGTLTRPKLEVFDADSRLMASNLRWTEDGARGDIAAVNAMVGAFPLEETSPDCALVTGLAPGAYTVMLSGVEDAVGTGLIEVYVLPY